MQKLEIAFLTWGAFEAAVFLCFQIAVSMLTYPFLLVGDLMAVNNCGLRAGLPPYAPAFASWIHCWRYLSAQGQLFRGSSLLFRRAPIPAAFPID